LNSSRYSADFHGQAGFSLPGSRGNDVAAKLSSDEGIC